MLGVDLLYSRMPGAGGAFAGGGGILLWHTGLGTGLHRCEVFLWRSYIPTIYSILVSKL